jgi:uncharacterized BrkB/YihY/UPF0761 family membrane protein
MSKIPLTLLFSCIFLCLLACSVWASIHQGVFAWGGLKGPDRYWTIATLMDAYFGFLTFYVWVLYKETRWRPRLLWLVAITVLGNMAMSSYVLVQLGRLRRNDAASSILAARNP